MKSPYGSDGYGREKYQEFSGVSLFSQMRAVCKVQLVNVKAQKPIVKFAKHDSARLRAKEYVARYLRLVTPARRAKS